MKRRKDTSRAIWFSFVAIGTVALSAAPSGADQPDYRARAEERCELCVDRLPGSLRECTELVDGRRAFRDVLVTLMPTPRNPLGERRIRDRSSHGIGHSQSRERRRVLRARIAFAEPSACLLATPSGGIRSTFRWEPRSRCFLPSATSFPAGVPTRTARGRRVRGAAGVWRARSPATFASPRRNACGCLRSPISTRGSMRGRASSVRRCREVRWPNSQARRPRAGGTPTGIRPPDVGVRNPRGRRAARRREHGVARVRRNGRDPRVSGSRRELEIDSARAWCSRYWGKPPVAPLIRRTAR